MNLAALSERENTFGLKQGFDYMDSTAPILIIEDTDEDYEACVMALTRDDSAAKPIFRCRTGDEVLDSLWGCGSFSWQMPDRPSLILLDLNMPGTDGLELLGKIKTDKALKSIPVVVMSSSDEEHYISECYSQGANGYLVKPLRMRDFIEKIACLREFWFHEKVQVSS